VDKSSLFYRRMQELFFDQAEPLEASDADTDSCCVATPTIPRSPGRGTRRIGNFVLHQVYAGPNIYVIDNFLNRSDLEYFRARIRTGTFQRSYVDGSTTTNCGSRPTDCEGSATLPEGCDADRADENKPMDKSSAARDRDPTTAGKRKALAFVDREHRTSTFLSFDKQQDSKIAAIEKRASELLGCWSSVTVEPLQLVRYTEGQVRCDLMKKWGVPCSPSMCTDAASLTRHFILFIHVALTHPLQFFNVHHDLADYDDETGRVELPPKSLFFRRRVVTLFCYLNEVEEGGETAFPSCPVAPASPIQVQDDSSPKHTSEQDQGETTNASNEAQPSGSLPAPSDFGAAPATPSPERPRQMSREVPDTDAFLKVQPKPGRAVLWSNVLKDGNPDPRTIHAGLPVRRGTKYGINVWICEG
jgi:2OG-Fe(II) oxygenase superfamily